MSAEPNAILDRLRHRWRHRLWWIGFLWAVAWGLPPAAVAIVFLGRDGATGWVAVVGGLAVLIAALGVAHRGRRTSDGPAGLALLARHLDACLPEVQHSSALLLRPADQLAVIERLQRRRVRAVLAERDAREEQDLLPAQPLRGAARAAGLGLLVALGLGIGFSSASSAARSAQAAAAVAVEERPTVIAPALVGTRLTVVPPAYTGLPQTAHDDLSVTVPAGSIVHWRLETQGAVDAAFLVVDPGRTELTPDREAPVSNGVFWGEKTLHETLVYTIHLAFGGQIVARSPFARVRVLADRAPTVVVRSPPLLFEVDPADGLRVPLVAEVDDDYGVAEVAIVATLALGAGEQVAFREARLGFTEDRALGSARQETTAGTHGKHRRLLSRTLDLEALGLEPGDELYFFVEARDNAPVPRRTRSASHVVRWPGDTRRSADLGAGIPMLLPPAMFRSQRQIIIDAERLIAEQGSIGRATFDRRSNNLGLDQHALRLRYGALLGEEFEDGRPAGVPSGNVTGSGYGVDSGVDSGVDHGHDQGVAPRAARMIDLVGELEGDLVHAHDSAENATFFPSEIRQTLKSSLANMWESEKYLRLLGPEQALPYAYRALRLLKKVQQASRVYVRRVGFAPTPLDYTRRLAGDDVDEVRAQRRPAEPVPSAEQPLVRAALRALGGWRDAGPDRDRTAATSAGLALDAVLPVVVSRAAAEEELDLGAVEDLRRLAEAARAGVAADHALSPDRLAGARALLWALLPPPEAAARSSRDGSEAAVWLRYRDNLGSP